ncbi:hypothetical protein ACIRVF_37000 [Kitasatospora sp. NPDC101157]|uniref:hypothetical protein n=1 Tax=Kitasatospora sp. NPDC101157 TaxID=3364098 RepID=UPI00382880AE
MTDAGTALLRLCAVPLPRQETDDLPDELFEAVDDLIDAHGAHDIADLVARAVHAGQATLGQGTVFLNVAVWSGTDNGTSMQHTLDDWVRHSHDPVRLHLALHHEAYPLPTAAKMRVALTAIGARHPRLREACERHLAQRPPDPGQAAPPGRPPPHRSAAPTGPRRGAVADSAEHRPGGPHPGRP